MLDISHHLPNLPLQDSATVTRDLLQFMKSNEWRAFLGEQVVLSFSMMDLVTAGLFLTDFPSNGDVCA